MSNQRSSEITSIKLASLTRSLTNPRKSFDQAKLEELSASIRQHGVITPLLVRPAWCVGWDGHDDSRPLAFDQESFEIVAGERRYRGSLLAELEEVPCIIRPMGDSDSLELQLIENLQRDDLTPIEEAEGYRAALDLRDESGKPRFTVEDLARRTSRSTDSIHRALKLINLPPMAREALENKIIDPSLAAMIGRIPGEKAREAAAKAIIKPQLQEEPLSIRQARELIQKEYMISLSGAPFDQNDETLVADMPACEKCPFRTGNNPEFKLMNRGDVCTNVSCYKEKCAAHWLRWSAENTIPEKNIRALPSVECVRIFQPSGELVYDSKYVRAKDLPPPDLLKDSATDVPTWRELAKEAGVETLRAQTPKGGMIELFDREQVIAAVKLKQGDKTVLKTRVSERPMRSQGADLDAASREREQRKASGQRLGAKVHSALMEAVGKAMTAVQFRAVVQCLFACDCSPEGVIERRGVKDERKMAALIQGMDDAKLKTFLLDLVCDDLVNGMGELQPQMLPLCLAFKVDLKALKKEHEISEKAALEVKETKSAYVEPVKVKKTTGRSETMAKNAKELGEKIDAATDKKRKAALKKLVAKKAVSPKETAGEYVAGDSRKLQIMRNVLAVLATAGSAGVRLNDLAGKVKERPAHVKEIVARMMKADKAITLKGGAYFYGAGVLAPAVA